MSEDLRNMQRNDELVKRKLGVRDAVQKMKSDNIRLLSAAKTQLVERNLDKRYDIDGFERYRVLPNGLSPNAVPASNSRRPTAHSSVQKRRTQFTTQRTSVEPSAAVAASKLFDALSTDSVQRAKMEMTQAVNESYG